MGPIYSRFTSVLKECGYHDLEAVRTNATGSYRSGQGMMDTLSRKTKFSIFMHIIFIPFMIRSRFHFSSIALFRINQRSNALALCAIATILLAQGRGSVTYESRAPTGSSVNACFLLPHRTQSPPVSSSSHREQNCCTQKRWYVNLASSVYSIFWVVSKS